MVTSNPFDVLITHDRWATTNIINACEPLTDEQFHHVFEMGLGSLHDTITHILGAMHSWTDMLHERELRPRLEGARRTLAELLALHTETFDNFESIARAHQLDATASGSRGGQKFTFSRGTVITHVTTHGMHHRAQCINMLRHLGVDPLPQSSVLQWMLGQMTE